MLFTKKTETFWFREISTYEILGHSVLYIYQYIFFDTFVPKSKKKKMLTIHKDISSD